MAYAKSKEEKHKRVETICICYSMYIYTLSVRKANIIKNYFFFHITTINKNTLNQKYIKAISPAYDQFDLTRVIFNMGTVGLADAMPQ